MIGYANNILLLTNRDADLRSILEDRYALRVKSFQLASSSPATLRDQVYRSSENLCVLCDIEFGLSISQAKVIREEYPHLPIHLLGPLDQQADLAAYTTLGVDRLIDTSQGHETLFQLLESEILIVSEIETPKPAAAAEPNSRQPEEGFLLDDADNIQMDQQRASFALACRDPFSIQLVETIQQNRGRKIWSLRVRPGSDYIFAVREILSSEGISFRETCFPQIEGPSESKNPVYCLLPGFQKIDPDSLGSFNFLIEVHFTGEDDSATESPADSVCLELAPLALRPLDRVEYFSRFIQTIGRVGLADYPGFYLSEHELKQIIFFDELESFASLWSWLEMMQKTLAERSGEKLEPFELIWKRLMEFSEMSIRQEYLAIVKKVAGAEPGEELLDILGFPKETDVGQR